MIIMRMMLLVVLAGEAVCNVMAYFWNSLMIEVPFGVREYFFFPFFLFQ